jgi:hypothetical protein
MASVNDAAVESQRRELKVIEAQLRAQEADLSVGWAALKENQRSLSTELARALALADQASGSQKTSLERLKAVIATLRAVIEKLPKASVN